MKVELLVANWSSSCRRAEAVWREVAHERTLDFKVVDVDQPQGRILMQRLQLKTIPALLVDGQLVAIGVQSEQAARAILDDPQRGTRPRCRR
jgi:thioredoxin-like negative regulator of GroEL